MRLVGLALDGPAFDGRQMLDLGPLTSLWGQNDAGKSTTLRTLEDLLNRARSERVNGPGLEVEVDEPRAEQIAVRAFAELQYGGEYSFSVGHAQATLAPPASAGHSALTTWVQHCLRAIPSEASPPDALANRLVASRLLLLEPGIAYLGGELGLRLWWGLRVDAETDGEIRAWLEQLGVSGDVAAVVPAFPDPVTAAVLPRPLHAPTDWPRVERDLRHACESLANDAVEWARRNFEDHVAQEVAVDRALAALIARASERLPPFVADRYGLEASREADGTVALSARRKIDGLQFPVAQLAQGFHLWAQLAALSLANAARAVTDEAARVDSELEPRAHTRVVTAFEVLVGDEWDSDLFAELIDRGASALDPLTGERDIEDLVRLAPQFVIVDEPEAHLHPLAQRQAARWIEHELSSHAGQIVMASHAPAFLGLGGDARLIHVRRDESQHVTFRALNPRDLDALHPTIAELGFDRGELLAFHRVVLFVEGATDKAALEALYPEQLRELGVLIQPFHGVKTHRRVTEAELVLRVLGAPLHVLVDDLTSDELRALQTAGEDELEALAKKAPTSEIAFVAGVRLAAVRERRDVRFHAIPVKDVLGLLDDDVVAAVAASEDSKCKRYPGFAQVLRRAAEGGRNYNALLPEFGVVKSPEFFAEVCRRMRMEGLRAPDLERVLAEITAADRRDIP